MPLNPILIHPATLRYSKPKGYVTDLHSRQTQHLPSFKSDEFKPDHSIYTNVIVTKNGHIYERGERQDWKFRGHITRARAAVSHPRKTEQSLISKQNSKTHTQKLSHSLVGGATERGTFPWRRWSVYILFHQSYSTTSEYSFT